MNIFRNLLKKNVTDVCEKIIVNLAEKKGRGRRYGQDVYAFLPFFVYLM